MTKIYPVLLAGGSGTRLWPLSRKSYPKQFSKLLGEQTLFQKSALRLLSSELIEFEKHIVVTNSDFRFITAEQLQEVGIEPGPILIEPSLRNTAPAILAATLFAQDVDPESILLVAPSDHIIPNSFDFHKAVMLGIEEVKNGKIVTFGITPTYPECGYGYLQIASDNQDNEGAHKVTQFCEKPDIERAKRMLVSGDFLWNAGIFLFKAKDIISAFKKFHPKIFDLVQISLASAKIDLGFLRLNPANWDSLENISMDYAIMEKATNIVAVSFGTKWSDLGGWDAVWSESDKDHSGNALSENAHAIDCVDTLLRSENKEQEIVGLGLSDIIAIAMPDAVLVANKNQSQNVKKVVQHLKEQNIQQAEIFPKDHRPWGWFERLANGDRFQVKRILVNSGAALSLQSHRFRSEHWIVVQGTAKVTIADQVKLISEGESVYVPIGAVHRMENPTESPMILIEVQTGSYFGEDDIIRYDDVYARN
jgi:mannose-1-phosphate guanylyltransferase/mannose-6-phosphate isomerase